MIEYQVKLIRKFVTDKFTHIIADNSSDIKVRSKIFELCQNLDVLYVSVPEHGFSKNESHGAAMHWIYKNVIKKRNSRYFGFIDHDIFPTNCYSIIKKLQNKLYGRVLVTDYRSFEDPAVNINYWSLWAGFCFYHSDLLNKRNVYSFNFFPKVTMYGVLDTGGGLWKSVYRRIPFPGELAKFQYVKYRHTGDRQYHSDYYEHIDDWVHMMNLSEWKETSKLDEKLNYFNDWINQLLR